MKYYPTYEEYSNELELNEGIFRNLFSKVYNFFISKFGNKGQFIANNYLQAKGKLKMYGVQIFPWASDPDFKERAGIEREIAMYVKTEEGAQNMKKLYAILEADDSDITSKLRDERYSNLKPEEVKAEIIKAWKWRNVPNVLTPFIWGAPGIGKSQVAAQAGKIMKIDVIIFNCALRDPVDFIGMPSVNKIPTNPSKKATYYNLPIIFPRIQVDDKGKEDPDGNAAYPGLLFFDELNLADDRILKAAQSLILDKGNDSYKLPSNWTMLAAGNRDNDATLPLTSMGTALSTRFRHINMYTTPDDFVRYATGPHAKIKIDDEEVPAVDNNILSFIKFHADNLHNLDRTKADEPWANPRTWTAASTQWKLEQSEARKSGRNLTDDEVEQIFVQNIGRGMAKEFVEFLKLLSHIRPEDLDKPYTDPDHAPLPTKMQGAASQWRVDQTYALLGAIAFKRYNKPITMDQFNNLITYIIRIGEGEYSTYFISMILKYHPHLKKDPKISDVMHRWDDKFGTQLNSDF